jgi:glucosamine--fructose-6-phosphate aminotransferase (isomerizing)
VQQSLMRQEIGQISEAARRLLGDGASFAIAGAALGDADPVMIATIARGSSDHACLFLKYAFELVAGIPVASIGPSVASIYRRELRLQRCAAIAVSQSGRSPDIVRMAEAARAGGALALSLTNTPGSPLAEAVDIALDVMAGEEKSVAATKSFVNSAIAGLMLVQSMPGGAPLEKALAALPAQLETALGCDWSVLGDALAGRRELYVLGRGPSFAIAQEVALKLKETCGLHAEAYSAAEVLHGPARIATDGFPVLVLSAPDEAEASTADVVDRLAEQGARVFVTSGRSRHGIELPSAPGGDPITDSLALIVPAYLFAEQLARRLGFDPDHPPHLRKVTETR